VKAAVVVFPGSNCERDVRVALAKSSGRDPHMVWHTETELPDVDLIVIPGGFAYGDYLRAGAMAARSPVMRAVVDEAKRGTAVLGICNGFQVLTESGLLPGALMRNAGLRYVCRFVHLRVETEHPLFTRRYRVGETIRIPVAHHDGNYFADPETLRRLDGEGRIAFRYCHSDGARGESANPNGSADDIAGIYNEERNVLGLMPHPERVADPLLGGNDGRPFFDGLAEALG